MDVKHTSSTLIAPVAHVFLLEVDPLPPAAVELNAVLDPLPIEPVVGRQVAGGCLPETFTKKTKESGKKNDANQNSESFLSDIVPISDH